MSGRQSRVAWGCVLAVSLLFCITISTGHTQTDSRTVQAVDKPAASPPPENLLPAAALAYVGWDGSNAHQQVWQATAAYQSLYETGLADAIRKLMIFVLQQTGAETEDILPIIDQISTRGVSLAISRPENGPPLPRATVVIREGKALFRSIDSLLRRSIGGDLEITTRTEGARTVNSLLVPNSPGVEFGWWVEGEHLVLAGGIDVVRETLAVADGRAPNITSHSLWEESHRVEAGQTASLVSWLDFAALRETYGPLPVPPPNPEAPPMTVGAIAEALGLGQLGPLVYRSGYEGAAMWSEMTLDAPEPRTGLLAAWGYGTVSLEDLPPLPQNVTGFYARSMDFSTMHDATLDLLRNIARLGPPQAPRQLEEAITEVSQALGISLKDDLFDPLGDLVCLYADPLQGIMGFGAVLAVKVDDAARLRVTLSNLLLQLATQSRGEVAIRAVPKYGREMSVLQFREAPFSPAVCVDDDWLVVGLTTQAVESFLLRLDGRLPKWEPGPDYKEALAEAEGELAALSVTDPRETIKQILTLAPTMLSFVQMAMSQQARRGGPAAAFPISVDDIPPTELVTAPLFPNVSVCRTDADGIRWRSRTSVPSIPLMTSFGGGSGVAVTGTLVALLLPAVQQARMAARRTQSKNNLKQIGLAMHNYHDVHSKFPPGTHPNDDLDVEERLSWMAEILPFIEQAALFNQLKFDEAWDSEANTTLTAMQIPVYLNPNRHDSSVAGATHYVGLAGVGEEAPTLPLGDKRVGVFGYNRATRIRDITDGTSNTIAVSESTGAGGNESEGADRWAAGGKSTIRALTQKPYINGPDGLGGFTPGGCNVLFCDGAVRFLSENIDSTVMEHLTTIQGGEAVGAF